MKILITGGGTREAIDGVRFITNLSSGQTAIHLAEHFASEGHEVRLLASMSLQPWIRDLSLDFAIDYFSSSADLNESLKHILEKDEVRAVVHAAAVSDFVVERIEQAGISWSPQSDIKIDSSQPIHLKLKPGIKIIDHLRRYSSSPLTIVGFKLTHTRSAEDQKSAIDHLAQRSHCDFIIHNDLSQIHENQQGHSGTLHRVVAGRVQTLSHFSTKTEMADLLSRFLGGQS